jgi:hypothetical protein
MSIRRDSWFNLPPDVKWEEIQLNDLDFNKVKLLYPKSEKDLEIYQDNHLDMTGIILLKEGDYYYVIEGNHRVSEYISNKKIVKCQYIFVGSSLTGMKCPLIKINCDTPVKLYAEKKLINHWSQLYENDKNPDIN